MSFALMGDMVLAGKSAFFLQAFRGIGLVPDGGATYILPRLIGMARARIGHYGRTPAGRPSAGMGPHQPRL